MSAKQWLALVMCFIWLGQGSGQARQKPEQERKRQASLAWNELGPMVVDRKVGMTLPDGTRLERRALAVRPEALVLGVTKTSNRKVYPKGQTSVPRWSVREVRVIKHNSGGGKVVGGTLGVLGGVLGASWLAYVGGAAGAWVGLLAVVPLATTGGYYAGRELDREVTRITIVPDQPNEHSPAATSSSEEVQP
jgi:hypothetical protein